MSNPQRILVTGSEGLVGKTLTARLRHDGHNVVRLDLRAPDRASRGDVRDTARVRQVVETCDGVVHLAAVSRVITGERDPALCWDTNVRALRGLLRSALDARPRPWIVFASSREVYGQPDVLPAKEDAAIAPVNVYGRAKATGERLCGDAAAAGLRVSVLRLSNVYGRADDHVDRVVPAFVRAAVSGASLRVDGSGNTFDFTQVDDVAGGIRAAIDLVATARCAPPPIHLVSGTPTTLGELATRVVRLCRSPASIVEAPPRSFDVSRFHGDPARARALLGWRARTSLDEGLLRLAGDLRQLVHASSATAEAS